MSIYFFDSSALVKRYLPEKGTHWLRTLSVPTAGHSILVASITPVEVMYDSIQLATALISQQQLSIQNHTVIFTTVDSRLEGIAQQTGLSTENPSQYS